jgi:hypothetical protein
LLHFKNTMTITYDQIAKRAYEIWKEEGQPAGQDAQHWLRAEDELRQQGMKKQRGKKITSQDPAFLKTPRGENL